MNAALAFDSRAVLSWILQAAIKSSGEPQIKIDEVSSSLALSPTRVRECLQELEQFGFLRLPVDDLTALSSVVVGNVCIELEPGQYILSETTRKEEAAVGREQIGLDQFMVGGELYRGTVEDLRNSDGSLSGWCELRIIRNPEDFVKQAKFIDRYFDDAALVAGGLERPFDLREFYENLVAEGTDSITHEESQLLLDALLESKVVDLIDGVVYQTLVFDEELKGIILNREDRSTGEEEHLALTKEFESSRDAWGYFDEFRSLLDVQFWAARVAASLVPDEDETLFVNVDEETYDQLAPNRDEITVVRIGGAIFRVKEGATDARRWPGLPAQGQSEEREAS